jgi:hypothetical protein
LAELWSEFMLASDQIDEAICLLASWDRPTLIGEFLAFQSDFPIDLTPAYLATLTTDYIRHVFLAVCVQNQRLPDVMLVAA